MFDQLIAKLRETPRKIVFTEGHDARILEAAAKLKQGGFLTPILVGNVDVVKAKAAEGNFDIEGLEILDPATFPEMEKMVEMMVELRKGKMSPEDCRSNLQTTSARCSSRWAMPTLCSAAPPTPRLTPSVRLCSWSRPARARIWYPPASLWPATARTANRSSSPWATARSTSTIRTPSTRKAT